MKIEELIQLLEEMKEAHGPHTEVRILEAVDHWIPDATESEIYSVRWFQQGGVVAITKKAQ